MCADDCGSAFEKSKAFKTHLSIFNGVSRVAGLRLSWSTCVVVVVSLVELSDAMVYATENWLSVRALVCLSSVKELGENLGWWLCADSVNCLIETLLVNCCIELMM